MFPEQKEISGRRLVPQLAIGCILFTIFGLLGTYWAATAMQSYLAKHPFGKPAPSHASGDTK